MNESPVLLQRTTTCAFRRAKGGAVVFENPSDRGCEDADDAFFGLCEERYGMVTEELAVESMEYMWDKTKRVTVYLRRIARVGGTRGPDEKVA